MRVLILSPMDWRKVFFLAVGGAATADLGGEDQAAQQATAAGLAVLLLLLVEMQQLRLHLGSGIAALAARVAARKVSAAVRVLGYWESFMLVTLN